MEIGVLTDISSIAERSTTLHMIDFLECHIRTKITDRFSKPMYAKSVYSIKIDAGASIQGRRRFFQFSSLPLGRLADQVC